LRIRNILNEALEDRNARLLGITSLGIIIIYIISLFTSCHGIILQFLVTVSSTIFAYCAVIPFNFFTGRVRKIYLEFLIAILLIFFIEVNYCFIELFKIPIICYMVLLLPAILIASVSAYIATYYIFDFWIAPIVGSSKQYFVTGIIGIIIISPLMFVLGVVYKISFYNVLIASLGFPLFLILLYEYKYFKDGLWSKSWFLIILTNLLIVLGGLLLNFSLILNCYVLKELSRILYMLGYLIGSYGFIIHKF